LGRFWTCAFATAAIMNLTGCSSIYFAYQAGRGQLKLMNHARPIKEVLADPTTDPKLAKLLEQIPAIKKYSEQSGLKPTPNYSDYVKLDQDAVVYVVTVSDPLQFKVKLFSFPFVGSFNYIGWFAKKDAEEFAQTFRDQGLDVDVRGASAYSTLGWFKDPLLSTMIGAEPDLVNIVIHESVHATLYINNQSYFNESIASYVAGVLTEDYYRSKNELETPLWKEYQEHEKRYLEIQRRMALAYTDLNAIYGSTQSDSEKLQKKKDYLDKLRAEFTFRRPINNATLVQFQTYDPSDQGFGRLYDECGKNVSRFMKTLSTLKSSDFEQSQQEKFGSVLAKFKCQ
jgi:predicted aminopeptidase